MEHYMIDVRFVIDTIWRFLREDETLSVRPDILVYKEIEDNVSVFCEPMLSWVDFWNPSDDVAAPTETFQEIDSQIACKLNNFVTDLRTRFLGRQSDRIGIWNGDTVFGATLSFYQSEVVPCFCVPGDCVASFETLPDSPGGCARSLRGLLTQLIRRLVMHVSREHDYRRLAAEEYEDVPEFSETVLRHHLLKTAMPVARKLKQVTDFASLVATKQPFIDMAAKFIIFCGADAAVHTDPVVTLAAEVYTSQYYVLIHTPETKQAIFFSSSIRSYLENKFVLEEEDDDVVPLTHYHDTRSYETHRARGTKQVILLAVQSLGAIFKHVPQQFHTDSDIRTQDNDPDAMAIPHDVNQGEYITQQRRGWSRWQ